MTADLTVLVLAVLLAFVQVALYSISANLDYGPRYTLSPRDRPPQRAGSVVTGRLHRAYGNYLEMLPLFAIAVLVAHVSGTASWLTAAASWIYLAARIVYIPCYGIRLAPAFVRVERRGAGSSGHRGRNPDLKRRITPAERNPFELKGSVMAETYDLVVIGTGPGGYVCAIRAAQLGMKVAVVEKRGAHGGTCLNIGCIPSKALLHASELYEEAGNGFSAMGIDASPKLDLAKMLSFKDEAVKGNTQGIDFLFKKNKIESHDGVGRVTGPGTVEVKANDGSNMTLNAKAIVIATGSDSVRLPGIEVDEKRVVTSTGALDLSEVPNKMLVIGGGIIGLELGSVWRRLGSEVQVVEFLDRIAPSMDGEVAKQFMRILKKQGIAFTLGHKATSVDASGNRLKATIEPASGGEAQTLEADVVLVAVGRSPYTEGLGLEEAGVETDERGRIAVDNRYKTSADGIYAIGDVIHGPMLAHKAEDEGVAVAEILAGQAGHVNYGVIPDVIYTYPEVAKVGKTEEELKQEGVEYRTGKFPFTANGRAKANHQTEGFVKVLADAKTDRVLGVHILGPDAGNMIAEAAVLMEFGGSAEDLARTSHAHPTLTEAVREAALAVDGRALHM